MILRNIFFYSSSCMTLIFLATFFEKTDCSAAGKFFKKIFEGVTCGVDFAVDRTCAHKYDGEGLINANDESGWDKCCRSAYIQQCLKDQAEENCKEESQTVAKTVIKALKFFDPDTPGCKEYRYGTPTCFWWYLTYEYWILVVAAISVVAIIVAGCCVCYCFRHHYCCCNAPRLRTPQSAPAIGLSIILKRFSSSTGRTVKTKPTAPPPPPYRSNC